MKQKSFQIFKLFSNEVKLIFEAVQSTKLRFCYVIYDSLVDEEIFINLLRTNCGTFFIRVQSHSYAHDVKEKHKRKYNEIKMNSLRSELKKWSKQ